MKSWNSVHNLAIPALVVFVEAGWAWAWFSANANLARGVPADLPFLALLIPAVIAVAISGVIGRIRGRLVFRLLLMVPLGLVVAAISAGVIGCLYEHSSFWVLALHPWTITGEEPGSEAAIAWVAAALAVGRGAWLGFNELQLSFAVRSFEVAGFAYVLFFIVGSIHHGLGSFHPSVGVAGTLVVISFPAAISVVALVNERELERNALSQQRDRPSLAWLGAVLVPMAVIGAVGAVLALAIGPLSGPIGRAIRRLVLLLGGWLEDFARLFGHGSRSKPPLPKLSGAPVPIHVAAHAPLPPWVTVVAGVVAAAAVIVMIFFIIKATSFLHHRRSAEVETEMVDEEKESVFSFSHVLDQLRALFNRLFRRHDPTTGAGVSTRAANAGGSEPETVRRHYRRFLRAARSAGYGRGVSETALELQTRISGVAEKDGLGALNAMRVEYELVRYGGKADTAEQLDRVRQHAEIVVALLEQTGEGADAERIRSSAADWVDRRPPAGSS